MHRISTPRAVQRLPGAALPIPAKRSASSSLSASSKRTRMGSASRRFLRSPASGSPKRNTVTIPRRPSMSVPCHEAYAATRDAARNATESP
jgi:hypothetical protein